ncbi:putative nonsense-mediated mRNA decay protein Upf3 [Aspergillus candidus]|uniref:Smg-4/UPF3 family-domain-containing protein n=1 Tax=Aspergillus candidus TaxID=41067 RepID=A0A2I2EZS3_ASPCN|nr:Smg-4/UPF3 family-domain-containing protein [Aspergillus candidus]PLB33885.1 Smg-4/UPF3 family-domain-containing protein [Aspergillus candidus]
MTQNSAGKPAGGVLQISAAATQKNTPTAPRKAPKPAAPRLKLLVRRLPPGLTQTEFETVLGPEWKAGAGKVDWFQYKPGKVSKDPAKPSRPSRAYIHVTAADHTIPLSDKVRQSSFVDARNTSTDPVLIGPPSLEFAPYAKVPGSRVRKDARQGTIDQDPEFIAFLESLTQPITKPSVEASDQPEDKKEGPTVTPLIQYIRDKKANKAKDAGRSSKHGKSDKDSRAEKVQAKKLLQRSDKDGQSAGGDKPERKSKSDRATKEAVRAANKQAALVAKQSGRSGSQSADSAQSTPTERKRERGNAAVAAKILQRDLGLAQSGGRRKGGRAAESDAAKNEAARSPSEPPKKEILTKSKAGGQNQRGKGSNNNSSSNTPQPSEQPEPNGAPSSNNTTPPPPTKPSRSNRGKQAAVPAPTAATQAFLKHANPSQGVTEPLLDTAFSPFGKILRVEIDKKKGFGYVDFADPDALQRAIAASPVTVAQSQVVVLERKANPGGEKGRGKGRNESQASGSAGGGSGGGGGSRSGKAGEGGSGSAPSRGSRGGRGRNKGGSKGNTGAAEGKDKPSEK